MRPARAVIAGGGIGGLASAIALHRRGWDVRVLEQASAIGEVGAGISLWPNALRALDLLGAGEEVRARGSVDAGAGFRRPDGRWLFRTDFEAFERRFGPTILIHRADLIDILLNALPPEVVTLNARLESARVSTADAVALHGRGEETAELLVGADGIDSTVRAQFWPGAPPPSYAGYTTYRFIVPPAGSVPETSETWGRGERAGIFPFHDGSVYSYFGVSVPEGTEVPDPRADLQRRFGEWHDPLPELITRSDPAAILHHDIYSAPVLDRYATGRVVLVGDAAHAMTPDYGQGGCTSLEDAVELADQLAAADDLASGLRAYDAVRRPRTQSIARQSARFGRVGQWRSRPATAIRNATFRILPPSSLLAALKPILSWRQTSTT
jgi:2-polyprenyl-6-methoxyphenol hydroxylase-like FAD-dependent oxidoreductase